MSMLAVFVALILIFGVLWDAFETIILPRRVRRKLRITRAFYQLTWWPWSALARRILRDNRREAMLSFYGPLALIGLLVVWAAGLLVGFALLQWALGSHLAGQRYSGFLTDLYFSGTSFFTLGLGDLAPQTPAERLVTVFESGLGFGFLALIISYLPVLYQAFSRREVSVSLLDARAGSPPTAVELLRRTHTGVREGLPQFLSDWERWAAELLESQLSYPSIGYFRSQHENQSWLSALTVILDTCALVLTGAGEMPRQQAKLTFAIARHAAVDLAQVFGADYQHAKDGRLSAADLARVRELLDAAGLPLRADDEAEARLAHLRHMYEPYVLALAHYFVTGLPSWLPDPEAVDDWQSSPTE
ncbi:MAG TPA: potassium channel family protein [Ktedonobacterales bacterium]|nr:potassium channel family protein [Ktedonobacterales bacterium]